MARKSRKNMMPQAAVKEAVQQNEKELLRTLREVYADKILLIVSHRHSTLTDCTRIIRLENGKAVELETEK